MDILAQRFGADRVRLLWDVGAAPAIEVPALSLQPLLENAFVHAVEPRAALTTLRITMRVEGGRLLVSVTDDGPGPLGADATSHGVALDNLRQRLRSIYGEATSLRLEPRAGGGCVARLELPAHG